MNFRSIAKVGACMIVVGMATLSTVPVIAASPEQPLPDTGSTHPVFPRVGSHWTLRTTDIAHGTVQDVSRTAMLVTYKGVSRYGIGAGTTITVLDQSTRNVLAILKNGREDRIFQPDEENFLWPLWVGETWQPAFNELNPRASLNFLAEAPIHKVEAYEEITVPAGTFRTFRIRTSPGWLYSSTVVDWYAPDIGLIVKRNFLGISNEGGFQQTTTELLTRPDQDVADVTPE